MGKVYCQDTNMYRRASNGSKKRMRWRERLQESQLNAIKNIEITSWLVSAYDFYSRVVKDR